MENCRILLVDDHPLICAGLRMLVSKHPDFDVVGEASNSAEALNLLAAKQPHLVLLDIDLGNEDGLVLMVDLRQRDPQLKIIVLTGIRDPDVHQRAILLGARGLVLKDQASDVLLQAIEAVTRGEIWIGRRTISNLIDTLLDQRERPESDPELERIATLTPREHEVITLLCQGLKNDQIAARLFVNPGTVRNYLNIIYQKLDVADRLQLAVFAFRHGLAQSPAAAAKAKAS